MRTRAFLASLVPIIVNTVLNEHQLVLDIVAFVALGDFPRSRLGEKQRGKILASWVSRKMRTIAQFSIRDPDAEGSVGTVVPEEALQRRGSGQSGAIGGPGSMLRGESALRHVESITQLPVAEEHPHMEGDPLMIDTRSKAPTIAETVYPEAGHRNDDTPTNETPHPLNLNTSLDYSPAEQYADVVGEHPYSNWDNYGQYDEHSQPSHGYPDYPSQGGSQLGYTPAADDSPVDMPAPLGGLRVMNRTSAIEDDWGEDALRQLNLAKQ